MKKNIFIILIVIINTFSIKSQVWVADQGDGTYINPILHSDYSDPDVIRVDDDYYMVASSFTCFPGIPVLHSKDLVNWKVINYVYDKLPFDKYYYPDHGKGSWAPSIRYYNGLFYVYFCTPQEGLFVAYTDNPINKWKMKHLLKVSQWEDPCPFWDDNGDAYLIRTKLCGGPVYIHKMSKDGLNILDNGTLIYCDEINNPTLEGLKIIKKDNWYYIFAPAGGVKTGWQTVLRSKKLYGPYESKRVLDEGNGINGPHQGGIVNTKLGEWWFIHFQDKDVYGRVVHLQPVVWNKDWPVIGIDDDNDGCGAPVLRYRKPKHIQDYPIVVPETSDDFNDNDLGKQWQWQAIQSDSWYSLKENPGFIRLNSISSPTENGNLYYTGNLLLQKLPAMNFKATVKMNVQNITENDRCGLVMMGRYHTYIAVENNNGKKEICLYEGKYENCGFPPIRLKSVPCLSNNLWFRVKVYDNSTCEYFYSYDGEKYLSMNEILKLDKGVWIGTKMGIFCITPNVKNSVGYVDVDYFYVER